MLSQLHPRRFFVETWRHLDAEAAGARQSNQGRTDLGTTTYVWVVGILCLIASDLNYLGGYRAADYLATALSHTDANTRHPVIWFLLGWMVPKGGLIASSYLELFTLGYWAVVKVIAYLVIPVAAIALHPRLHLRDMGVGWKDVGAHLPLYLVLMGPVLLLCVGASFFDGFNQYYPFYVHSGRSLFDFVVWQVLYMAQFLALEFFFRGFLLQTSVRTMGASVIIAMMVPYVMIHFGKPWPETVVAVVAGIVLGTLALQTRSIWPGVLVHAGVALTMDVACIAQKSGIS